MANRVLQWGGVQLGTAWCSARPIREYYLSLHLFFACSLFESSWRARQSVFCLRSHWLNGVLDRSPIRANERRHLFSSFQMTTRTPLVVHTDQFLLTGVYSWNWSDRKETSCSSAYLSLVSSEDVNNKPNQHESPVNRIVWQWFYGAWRLVGFVEGKHVCEASTMPRLNYTFSLHEDRWDADED